MDMYQRDRFELLSAYLDGEVTAVERQQIEDWLTTDLGVQRLYVRVLKLRYTWQAIPSVPVAQLAVERTVGQMFPHFSKRLTWLWFGGVLCSLICLSALFQGSYQVVNPLFNKNLSPQLAIELEPDARLPQTPKNGNFPNTVH